MKTSLFSFEKSLLMVCLFYDVLQDGVRNRPADSIVCYYARDDILSFSGEIVLIVSEAALEHEVDAV